MKPEEAMERIFGDSLEKQITDDVLDTIKDIADVKKAVPDHEKSRIERELGK